MGGQMDSQVSLQVHASRKNLYYISCIIQLTCNQLVLWAPACVDLHWWPNDEKLVLTCIDLYRIWVRSKSMQVGGQIWLTLIRIPNPHILRKSGFLVISCFLHGRYALPGNMQLPPRTVVLRGFKSPALEGLIFSSLKKSAVVRRNRSEKEKT